MKLMRAKDNTSYIVVEPQDRNAILAILNAAYPLCEFKKSELFDPEDPSIANGIWYGTDVGTEEMIEIKGAEDILKNLGWSFQEWDLVTKFAIPPKR